jgi:tetratricopeptide (TPR) repeat protein
MKDFFDQNGNTPPAPDSPGEPDVSAQPDNIATDEISCPVCHRGMALPIPELCPSCQAPIQAIMSVIRVADLSIQEAIRDLRIGDLDSVSRRLALVRVTSKAHRLKAEVIQAMLDRLKGDPASALARLGSIRDQIPELPLPDDELAWWVAEAEEKALEDLQSMALCCEHYNFALFQAKRGHLEEARDSAMRALEHIPHHGPSHLLLAKTHFALRENIDAKYHLNRALASDPSDVSATRLLARINRATIANPLDLIHKSGWLRSKWTGPGLVVILLILLGLAALLSR